MEEVMFCVIYLYMAKKGRKSKQCYYLHRLWTIDGWDSASFYLLHMLQPLRHNKLISIDQSNI
jgi:hypothetical protein